MNYQQFANNKGYVPIVPVMASAPPFRESRDVPVAAVAVLRHETTVEGILGDSDEEEENIKTKGDPTTSGIKQNSTTTTLATVAGKQPLHLFSFSSGKRYEVEIQNSTAWKSPGKADTVINYDMTFKAVCTHAGALHQTLDVDKWIMFTYSNPSITDKITGINRLTFQKSLEGIKFIYVFGLPEGKTHTSERTLGPAVRVKTEGEFTTVMDAGVGYNFVMAYRECEAEPSKCEIV